MVESDFSKLKVALVPEATCNRMLTSFTSSSTMNPGMEEEEEAFVKCLASFGVQTLTVTDLLQTGTGKGSSRFKFLKSLKNFKCFPYFPCFPCFPLGLELRWMRDLGVSTPKGLLLGCDPYAPLYEKLDPIVFRLAIQQTGLPILLEKVQLEGGDIIVLNKTTLLVGIGFHTSFQVAQHLARLLHMDVYAVQLAPFQPKNDWTNIFVHLDSVFNVLDRDLVVAAPFFFETSRSNPLLAVQQEMLPYVLDTKLLKKTLEQASNIGWVTKIYAGTGQVQPLHLKLVDLFRKWGYRIVFVGGEKGSLPFEQWLQVIMYELKWQGANVLQLGPSKVIAYQHNIRTNTALKDAGVRVYPVQGKSLCIRYGGPHCLVMPLVRSEGPPQVLCE